MWLLLFALLGCDDFDSVAREDSVEAWQGWLDANPPGDAPSFRHTQALSRVEELRFDAAKADGTQQAWDAWLADFPDSPRVTEATKAREEALFVAANRSFTAEAWQGFLDACPKPTEARRARVAKHALAGLAIDAHVTRNDVQQRPVNLAEDPNGPLDGHAFTFDATLGGEHTVESLWYTLRYHSADGRILGSDAWPLLAPTSQFAMPLPDIARQPWKPGETRSWEWTTRNLPEGFKEVSVVASRGRLLKP